MSAAVAPLTVAHLLPIAYFDDDLCHFLATAVLSRRRVQTPNLRFLLPREHACAMPDPRSLYGLFDQLQDINPAKNK
jgi:hypothetical protein